MTTNRLAAPMDEQITVEVSLLWSLVHAAAGVTVAPQPAEPEYLYDPSCGPCRNGTPHHPEYGVAQPAPDVAALVRDLADGYHRLGLVRDHHDKADTTGWNVREIETCSDPLCREAVAFAAGVTVAQPAPQPDGLDVERWMQTRHRVLHPHREYGGEGCLCPEERDTVEDIAREYGATQPAPDDALRAAAQAALDALIWCSGSRDFGPGGIAEEGWNKGPRQTIDALRAALGDEP